MALRHKPASYFGIVDAQIRGRGFVHALGRAAHDREIDKLTHCKKGFLWEERHEWGIDENAWCRIEDLKVEPLRYFCHPRVLTEQPTLLRYYRQMTLLTCDALARLAEQDVKRIELGNVNWVDAEYSNRLALIVNQLISTIVNASNGLDIQHLLGLRFISDIPTIRRAMSEETRLQGVFAVRGILVNHLKKGIAQIVWKNDTTADYSQELHAEMIDRIAEVKGHPVQQRQSFGIRQRA